MDKVPRQRTPFAGVGFAWAVLLAPAIAAAIFILGPGLAELSIRLQDVPRLVGSLLFASLIVCIWGAVPSLVFGGAVLALIRRIPWRGPPHPLVYLVGGLVAAGLYVLAGLAVAGPAPGAAMFFAPWALRDLRGVGAEDWWMVASLLLAGTGAGLIYARFAKRG